MRFEEGGGRKKEWECTLKNNKPMYVNAKKGIEHPIFLNKKLRPTYRNKNGIVMEAKDCPQEYNALLKSESKKTLKTNQLTLKSNRLENMVKKTLEKKIVLNKKSPSLTLSQKKTSLPKPNKLIIGEYIDKLKKGEPLPRNKTVKKLTKFCKLASKKNAFVYTTKEVIKPTKKPKTPTPTKTKSPTMNPNAKTFIPQVKIPTPKSKNPTPKAKTSKLRNSFFGSPPKAKIPAPKPKTQSPVSQVKQPCGNGKRCKKGTKCNKKTGFCIPMGSNKTAKKTQPVTKRVSDSLQIMQYQEEELKELGLKKNDFYEDVCLVLKNIRKKLHTPGEKQKEEEWSSNKLVKMHDLVPHTRDKKGKLIKGNNVHREQYLGDKEIKFTHILGKGGYGRIHGGTYGGRPCAIKESLDSMDSRIDIEDYYGEIIKQNELFCQAHRAKLNQPKYAKIPKPLFIANMDKTPLLGMEPLDDSLYNFIKKSKAPSTIKEDIITHKRKMTKVITDMFECICNTLIYLQEKYDFYHRDMHCGNIMYRKSGETYQWFLIDFGMSTFKLHDYRFSNDGAGPYGKFNSELIKTGYGKGRKGHDLRLTLLFMFELIEDNLDKMILPEAFNILNAIYIKIKNDIRKNSIGNSPVFWHRGYKDAFNNLITRETEPKVFLAETIPQLRQIILNNRNPAISLKSKNKPKKEFIFVERKEGKKK
ncbi:MAG: hypothetical protein CMF80_07195 [Candidatus Marinimicrobia bacterium]|nr:hypothetical protein [Candidatus Neomarinimicrobiota bacterium]